MNDCVIWAKALYEKKKILKLEMFFWECSDLYSDILNQGLLEFY